MQMRYHTHFLRGLSVHCSDSQKQTSCLLLYVLEIPWSSSDSFFVLGWIMVQSLATEGHMACGLIKVSREIGLPGDFKSQHLSKAEELISSSCLSTVW